MFFSPVGKFLCLSEPGDLLPSVSFQLVFWTRFHKTSVCWFWSYCLLRIHQASIHRLNMYFDSFEAHHHHFLIDAILSSVILTLHAPPSLVFCITNCTQTFETLCHCCMVSDFPVSNMTIFFHFHLFYFDLSIYNYMKIDWHCHINFCTWVCSSKSE